MPSSFSIRFTVNGEPVELTLQPHALLLDVLRDHLDLKGAKRSCDMQVCGACTVLVDGAPVSACTYLAVEADGREILTVEGLEPDGRLDALQQAFIDLGAVQCGFCTPGMLLTARALLAEDPSPTPEAVFHYLSGSLCRCTGYRKIVQAVLGRREEPKPRPGSGALRVVGQPVPRVDAVEKVTGRARYVSDLTLPGMAYAKLLRSPYPHARLLRVDASRARALPGVYAVLTGSDLTWCDPYFGPAVRDRPILAIDVVRYEGEPIAAVAAVDEATALEALDLIEVDYEELRAVTTLEEALAPGAPLVHAVEPPAGHFADLSTLQARPGTNICHEFHYERGRGAAAFAEADLTVEGTYTFPKVQHYAMEPHAVLARWTEEDGLILWASTQNPFSVRVELAKMLGVPLGRIRIIVPPLGGGFGSKTYAKLEPIAATLARVAGRRPVRLAASAEEAFRTVRRCDARVSVRLGVRRDGTLLAAECRADFDVGAYADIGPRVVQKATYTATGPYRVPNVRLGSRAVYTNTTPGGAFRGFGVPQLAWAFESLMDEAAHRLDRDPVEFRRHNLLAHGEEFAPGDTPIDGKFEESLSRAAEAIRWSEAAADRGRGVAMMLKASLAPSVSEAIVRLHADGSVTVLVSTVEMGQGARTVMAQIAAEVLAVPLARVTVLLPDTGITPYDQTTSSSRSTTMTGRAVQEAAQDVVGQLLELATRELRAPAGELRVEDGAVVHGDRRLPYPELLQRRFGMAGGELIGRGVVAPGRSQAPLGASTPFWEMAVGAAEVSIDVETGAVTVDEYVSVADVGRCINPQLCQAQDEGAVVQGLGHTLFEEMVYEGGQLLNGTLVDYRVPRAGDAPRRLACLFVENADGAGPFGAKGAGEGSLIPVSAAVGNALARLTGVRMCELPLTPERVWRALRAQQPARQGGLR